MILRQLNEKRNIIEKNNDKNIKVAYRGKAEHINSVLDKVNELSRDNEVNRHAK